MSATDILLGWVLPLLVYSGAIVPLALALILDTHSERRHQRHRRLFIGLFTVQAVSFLPFISALLLHVPDAIHGLLWPFLVGVVLFLWGLLVLASECVDRLRRRSDDPGAKHGAAPNGGPVGLATDSDVPNGPPSVS
jgi:MFS family permease